MNTLSILDLSFKKQINELATHPLQSFEWGEFRKKTHVEVVRLGLFTKKKLTECVTMTVHKIPHTNYRIAYIPKSMWPSKDFIPFIFDEAKKRKCIFVKFEPNIIKEMKDIPVYEGFFLKKSSHPLFTQYTQMIDLSKDETSILSAMHPKTRYNIRVAQKHGVVVSEKNDERSFNEYLNLTFETTKRQGFFSHNKKYHELMWEVLKNSGIPHLLIADYKEKEKSHILAAWILFYFNKTLYYPYGASSDKFRNVMASTFMMWEAIKLGKKLGADKFDLWGSLGTDPDTSDPWFGFHRFKQGFGAQVVENIGSYDLVIKPNLYKVYEHIYKIRKIFLNIKRKLT